MTNPHSWMRIKEVAKQRRDTGARGLAQLVTRLVEAQGKLRLLHEYRGDYRTRYDNALHNGMAGEWFRNYQSFLANLDHAIALQTDVVTALEHDVAEAKKQVDSDQRRTDSYQIIDDRRTRDSLVRERRSHQRLQDEMAAPKLRLVDKNNR